MYSRNFYEGDAEMFIPQNYDGSAFQKDEQANEENRKTQISHEGSSNAECNETEAVSASPNFGGILSSIFKKIPLANFFMDGGKLELSKIKLDNEDFLIIGLALLLLFSKETDASCIIALIVLLFIR